MASKALQKPNETPIKRRAARRSKPIVGKYARKTGKHWTDDEIITLADDLFDWYNSDDSLLWIGDFFTGRMIARCTLSRLRDRNPYLDYIYGLCKEIQESRLFHLGFAGAQVQATIFALKNVCKWRSEPIEEPAPDKPITVVFKPHRLAEADAPDNNQTTNKDEENKHD